jgi:hypothetical protein
MEAVPGTNPVRPDWPPLPSPLDPFLRQLIGFVAERDGSVPHTVFLRDRPDGGSWPGGFLEVLLTSARARNFLRTMRGAGQTRHHLITETGRRWLSETGEPAAEHPAGGA